MKSLSEKRKEYFKQLRMDLIRAYNENTNSLFEVDDFQEVMEDLDKEAVKKLKEDFTAKEKNFESKYQEMLKILKKLVKGKDKQANLIEAFDGLIDWDRNSDKIIDEVFGLN